jgi:hypothetical protein
MANAKRSGWQAQFHSGKIGLVVFQKALEFWFTGKAFPRSGNIGIQDQRTWPGSASLVAVALKLTVAVGYFASQSRMLGGSEHKWDCGALSAGLHRSVRTAIGLPGRLKRDVCHLTAKVQDEAV